MKIEIQRGTKVYGDMPEAVHLLIIADSGEVKTSLHIYPRKITPENKKVRVEIASGDVSIKPPLSIEFDVDV